jgi:hypothetical protein
MLLGVASDYKWKDIFKRRKHQQLRSVHVHSPPASITKQQRYGQRSRQVNEGSPSFNDSAVKTEKEGYQIFARVG